MTKPRHQILFESVRIGPCVSKNRFYAAPHGVGYGYRQPRSNAAIRGMKAEGGWGVVCTEQVEFHPTSEMTPLAEHRLWDDRDVPALAAVAEAVHAHGALAAIELSHSGVNATNMGTRESPIGPSTIPIQMVSAPTPEPFHARQMDKQDIQEFRQWHRQAARRAIRAGFDVIYVYASLLLSLPNQFLSLKYNHRTDEYGGSLENRMRLILELLADTLEVAKGERAVAIRLTLDELLREPEAGYPDLCEFFDRAGELPDLWDLVVCGMGADAGSSRFDEASKQASVLANVKRLTSKPVVSVSVFRTADEMADIVRKGILDMVSAARPAIADPFLPAKIEAGTPDEIRYCIKCNYCVACDLSAAPVQCTQNPAFGEEWRRGWHPEKVPQRSSESEVLVVGAGPAGLECAATLGRRGYRVTISERRDEVGGRISREARLPGLALWAEVRDYRLRQLESLDNVGLELGHEVSSEEVVGGRQDVTVIATGAKWRRDGLDRQLQSLPRIDADACVFTPDDIMDGVDVHGDVVIYDDDHYYMGSVIAEQMIANGCSVSLVTPAAEAGIWTHATMEQFFIQQHLLRIGVIVIPHRRLVAASGDSVETACVFTGRSEQHACSALILVTARAPDNALYNSTCQQWGDEPGVPRSKVVLIGDAFVPGVIAQAIRSGHKFGREFDCPRNDDSMPRELVAIVN